VVSGGSSYDSIISIHSIGKDWGRLPHREPFYIKRSKDRRKDHHGHNVLQADGGQDSPPSEEQHDAAKEKNHSEGFEITV
jgi:hypothetical protein